jgi:hypothetical protein
LQAFCIPKRNPEEKKNRIILEALPLFNDMIKRLFMSLTILDLPGIVKLFFIQHPAEYPPQLCLRG